MNAGLVKGEGFAVDASIIKANARRPCGVPGDEQLNWSDPALSTRAVREYLETHDEKALAETLTKPTPSSSDPRSPLTNAQCCSKTALRKIARSVHEAARDVARRIAATPAYQRSHHERKKVEMLFAHLKRILKLDRLRLRGMRVATDQFTQTAAVQNLRRLAKLTSQGPSFT